MRPQREELGMCPWRSPGRLRWHGLAEVTVSELITEAEVCGVRQPVRCCGNVVAWLLHLSQGAEPLRQPPWLSDGGKPAAETPCSSRLPANPLDSTSQDAVASWSTWTTHRQAWKIIPKALWRSRASLTGQSARDAVKQAEFPPTLRHLGRAPGGWRLRRGFPNIAKRHLGMPGMVTLRTSFVPVSNLAARCFGAMQYQWAAPHTL